MVDVTTVKLKLNSGSAQRDIRSFKRTFKTVNRDIKAANDNFKTLGKTGSNTFKRLAVGATAFIAAFGIVKLVRSVARVTAQFEDLKTALNAVFGSIKEGQKAFDFVQDFATKTPFSVQTLTQALIQLKGAGIEPTAELLTTFGNAASVTTDRLRTFNTLVRIVSRSTAGRLGLEEINQLVDAGVPVFQILERQLGITRLEISEFGKTAEGARKIVKALLAGIDQRFGGAMESSLGNLSVAFSNFQIAIDNTLAVIGEGLGPALKAATLELTAFIEENEDAARALGEVLGKAVLLAVDAFQFFVQNIDLVKNALIGLLAIGTIIFFTKFVVAIKTAIIAIRLLTVAMLASPLAPFAAAALLVGGAIGLISLNADKTIPKVEALSKELDELAKLSKPAADRLTDVQEQIREINAAIAEREVKLDRPAVTGRGAPSSRRGRKRAEDELVDLRRQLDEATALRRQITAERFRARKEQEQADTQAAIPRPKRRPEDVIAKIRKDAIAPLEQFVTSLKNEEIQLRANNIALEQSELAAIKFRLSKLDLTNASKEQIAALTEEANALAQNVADLKDGARLTKKMADAIEEANIKRREGQRAIQDISNELRLRTRSIFLTEKQIEVENLLSRGRRIAAETGAFFDEAEVRADIENVQRLEQEVEDLATVMSVAGGAMKDVFKDFADDGIINLDRLLDSFIDTLATMAAEAAAAEVLGLFGQASGGSTGESFFSGALSLVAGLFEKGGRSESPSSTRAVSPFAFVNAPHLRTGNLSAFGIQQDEIPALLHPGEVVVPANQVANTQRQMREPAPIINFNIQTRDAQSFIPAQSELMAKAFMEGSRNRIRNRV